MRYAFELFVFIFLVIYFIIRNLIYIIGTIIWDFKIPDWSGIRKANSHSILDWEGRHRYYDTVFHYFYDINPKFRKLYPTASFKK